MASGDVVVRWVSPVGKDPSTGGGVARSIDIFMTSKFFFDGFHVDFLSLLKINFAAQVLILFKDYFIYGYRNFLVHSFFSPYVLVLLFLPGCRVVLLPHGEFKEQSLSIKRFKKFFFYFPFMVMSRISVSWKNVCVISSGDDELFFAGKLLRGVELRKIPDLVSGSVVFPIRNIVDVDARLNIVILSRLVKSKSVSVFLEEVVRNIQKFSSSVGSINIFFSDYEFSELARVRSFRSEIESLCDIRVFLHENVDRSRIQILLSGLPNKVPFLPSLYESFSYTLIELLDCEFKPMVWFHNDLTDNMKAHGLCVNLDYRKLLDEAGTFSVESSDQHAVQSFIAEMSRNTCAMYSSVFKEFY